MSVELTRSHHYRLFGLTLQCDFELPELRQETRIAVPDVLIEPGVIPSVFDQSIEFVANETGACLSIMGVARYWVSGGARIVVQPEADVPMRNVRLYLLGSAMGLLLHQRGSLPLHANAVEIDGKAFAFMGRSGAGKSTLAAAFHDQGYRVVADDVCVVGFDRNGIAFAYPGIPRLRLWEDALAATGRDQIGFERSYAGDEDYKKYDVPILTRSSRGIVPLSAIYLLDRGNILDITALRDAEVVEAVFANTYRGQFVRSAGNSRIHWEACLRLVREVPVFRFVRPWGHERLNDQIDMLLAHARSSIAPPPG